MRLFDTHCHFERADTGEIADILARARSAGVEKLMAVGGSPTLNASAILAFDEGTRNKELGTSSNIPEVIYAVGLDRDQIHPPTPPLTNSSTPPLTHSLTPPLPHSPTPSAWGEIGLDYHYSPETRKEQMALFALQLEEARRRDLPVVIHTREAAKDTAALLKEIPSRGIIHCFTGTPQEAKSYLDLGFYVSISGIVTFRAADNVRETALFVPDDRILIETDSPFLAPVPMRGKANEPAFIVHTCEFLAKLRGVAPDDFAELTFANAERILTAQ